MRRRSDDGRRWRPVLRRIAVATGLALAAALAPLAAAAAQEEPPPPPGIPIGELDIFTPLGTAPVAVTELGDIVTTDVHVEPQCSDAQVTNLCLGDTTGEGQLHLDGGPPPGGMIDVEGGFVERVALDPFIREAELVLHTVYDVPLDGRLRTYAAPEIRSYLVQRILDIIDRAAYGVALTTEEQTLLDAVTGEVLDADQEVAQYAHEEYLRFRAEGCLYSPPPAPPWVLDPVPLPAEVEGYCSRLHTSLELAFEITPPQPSVEHFTTWATYRHLGELGLDQLDTPAIQQNLVATHAAMAYGLGIGASVSSGLIIGAIAGVNAALLEPALLALTNLLTPAYSAVTGALPLPAGYAVGATAGLAAGVATIVLAAIVTIVVSSVLVGNHAQVGIDLAKAADAASDADDPFGIEALRAANAGLDLREGMTLDDLPAYRQPPMVARLMELVNRWWSVGRSGEVRADPTGVWADVDQGSHDWVWEITDAAGTVTRRDSLPVRMPDGSAASIRYRDRWAIVSDATGPGGAARVHPALQIAYQDWDGETVAATRLTDLGFHLTIAPSGGVGDAEYVERAEALEVVDPVTGEQVRARLVPSDAPLPLAGPRPTVAGRFLPGWTHHLRPNPVDEAGGFDLERFREGYEYAWVVQRYDEDAELWTDLALLPPTEAPVYGARFVPDRPGRYRAGVTMTDLDDPGEPDRSGLVHFEVQAPEVAVVDAAVVAASGGEVVRVDLLLGEDVPQDSFDVTVRWPGAVDGDPALRPVSTVSFGCLPATATTCDHPSTAAVPALRDALTRTLDPLDDLGAGVEVTITNGYGYSATRLLAIPEGVRPRFAAPPDDGQLALVAFAGQAAGERAIDVQVPVAAPSVPGDLALATVEPAAGDGEPTFLLRDPATGALGAAFPLLGSTSLALALGERPDGRWVLALSGRPGFEHLGIHEIPVTVVQDSGARASILLRLHVVPAPDDRFRVLLASDVDPADFAVDELPTVEPVIVGGKAEWGSYDGVLCVSLETPPAPRREHCAPVEEHAADDGTLAFPWQQLAPDGVDPSTTRLHAWLEDGERSWGEPHRVSFILRSAPPAADLAWDPGADAFTLGVVAGGAGVSAVDCTLDGLVVDGCFGTAGGAWSPGPLAPGPHRLTVVVHDAAGNWDTTTVDVVTYAARYDAGRCAAVETFAQALGITPQAMIRLGVDGLRGIAEAGGATPVTEAPQADVDCELGVTWDADEADGLAGAAAAWRVDVDELHRAGGWLVVVLLYTAIAQGASAAP